VSDHGELKFEHRQVMKAAVFEGSVRVPMQMAGPGIAKGKRIDSHIVSLLDVFPTLLDMAQESHPDHYKSLMGQSLLAVAGGTSVAPSHMRMKPGADERDQVISSYNWVEGNTGAYMIRSGHWKLMTYGHTYAAFKDYAPQLFNMQTDPDELHDVADQNADIVAMLMKKMRTVMDPDVVDRSVMKSDFARLKTRFNDNVDPSSKEFQGFVSKQDRSQFTTYVNEAKKLF
jgi:choline-sulfatase